MDEEKYASIVLTYKVLVLSINPLWGVEKIRHTLLREKNLGMNRFFSQTVKNEETYIKNTKSSIKAINKKLLGGLLL